jgi:hypothetical protein
MNNGRIKVSFTFSLVDALQIMFKYLHLQVRLKLSFFGPNCGLFLNIVAACPVTFARSHSFTCRYSIRRITF